VFAAVASATLLRSLRSLARYKITIKLWAAIGVDVATAWQLQFLGQTKVSSIFLFTALCWEDAAAAAEDRQPNASLTVD